MAESKKRGVAEIIIHKESRKKHTVAVVSVIILLVLLVAALKFVQVPYTTVEPYTTYEPFTVEEIYNETALTEVRIPTTHTQTVSIKEPIATPASLLETQPVFLKNEQCMLEPYNYTISYLGDLSELALNRAFVAPKGFRDSRTQSAYAYDKIKNVGYKDDTLYQKAVICNSDPRMMIGVFKRCHYQGDKKIECPNTETVKVSARSTQYFENPCTELLLWWRTSYDVNKKIRLEPELVSQKIVCYDGKTVRPRARYYDLNYISDTLNEEVFGLEGKYLDPIRIRGRIVGYREKPTAKQISDTGINYREREEMYETTKYKTELRNVTVEKTRDVTKYREVGEMREVVKYRSLWASIFS